MPEKKPSLELRVAAIERALAKAGFPVDVHGLEDPEPAAGDAGDAGDDGDET